MLNSLGLPDYTHAYSDENGFVDASDFHAMAISYAIDREMGVDASEWIDNEFPDSDLDALLQGDDWMDAMEARSKAMDMMEAGIVG